MNKLYLYVLLALVLLSFNGKTGKRSSTPETGEHHALKMAATSGQEWADRLEYVGVAVNEPGYHIWGSSPITGPGGKTHLFVARWPVSSKFKGWYTHSEIARYEGEKPEGPFVFKQVVVKGTQKGKWDYKAPHNPTIKKIGDRYALLYIANSGVDFPAASQRIGMQVSKSLEGPWKKVGDDGLLLSPPEDPLIWSYQSVVGVNNPTLMAHPDGRFFLYYKAMRKGDVRRMGVAVADKLEGPYRFEKEPLTNNETNIEDGYAFSENGKIYLLTTDNEKKSGLLWPSDDGFKFSTPTLGFDRMEKYISREQLDEATKYRGEKFERPQLLIQNGRPTHLYVPAGKNILKGDGSCSYVFKVNEE